LKDEGQGKGQKGATETPFVTALASEGDALLEEVGRPDSGGDSCGCVSNLVREV
jgi:hypothetical protein